MKMSFLRFNSLNRRSRTRIPSLVFAGAFAAIILIAVFIRTLESGVMSFGASVLKAETALKQTAATFEAALLADKQTLFEENKDLKKRLGEANAKLWSFTLLEKENRELKALLGRNMGDTDSETVLATVLASPPRSTYGTLVLDIGARHGITRGALVFLGGNLALGTISDVFNETAKVLLYSAAGREVNAMLGDAPFPVKARGRGSEFEINIPRGTDIKEGDLLRLPGIMPIIIGVVRAVEDEPTKSFVRVLAGLPANIYALETVLVRPHFITDTDETRAETQNESNKEAYP
ncbi:MAG: hypothetical protein COW88_03060 [Candidatus Lloydbacteria bacterium CG22_combo_CG10-13_8_21_14_all_47_15]|uniref:Cell shape-determining protein MreC n=1 Tax=Candidatus Lloydbacteria bacterium CG22_combo_CG10-13_8_21_14_all_47_15 TaxID=1974635 RepID=A0A2H0CTC2_9BACT|nr:MAG: hypothetical protein COW88_03060 [Candidatus Lloydbacteria bacterium CG22_combo_CG10-13_8_21_14_all_47_15]